MWLWLRAMATPREEGEEKAGVRGERVLRVVVVFVG